MAAVVGELDLVAFDLVDEALLLETVDPVAPRKQLAGFAERGAEIADALEASKAAQGTDGV